MADSTEAQEETPKNTKGVLTEQKKEEKKRRMAFLDAIEIGGALASSVDVGQSKEQKRVKEPLTISSDNAPPAERMRIGVPKTSTPAKGLTAGDTNEAALASMPQPTPTPSTRNNIDSVSMALEHTVLAPSGNEAPGVPTTKTTPEQASATPVLADGSGKKTLATPSSRVRTVARKQKSVIPITTGNSSMRVPVAYRARLQALAPTAAPSLEDTGPDSISDVTPGRSGGITSTSAPLALTTTAPSSRPNASVDHPGSLVSNTSATTKDAEPILQSNDSLVLATISSPTTKDAELISQPTDILVLATTSSHGMVAPCSADPGNGPSTDPTSTGPFRLYDLPQELQDAIFGFAYTEPTFNLVELSELHERETHIRKLTGNPMVEPPPHKVNEWVVSKRYFRNAAKAWVEAQTSPEVIRAKLTEFWLDRFSYKHFPPIQYEDYGSGLFLEFGKSFIVDLHHTSFAYSDRYISRCLRMRDLICVVREDFFDDIDRGYPWEVEFTNEELMRVLNHSGFTLPSTVEMLEMQLTPRHIYADTDAKKAIFRSNVDNLRRVLWQHKSKEPKPDKHANHGRMYMSSQVMMSTPTFMSNIVSDIMSSTTQKPSNKTQERHSRTIHQFVYIPGSNTLSEIISITLELIAWCGIACLIAIVWLLIFQLLECAENAGLLPANGVDRRARGYYM